MEYIEIDKLKPYEFNNKKHPEKQLTALTNSIKRFGFDSPVIIDKDNVIIAGHARVTAAKKAGLDKVPIIKKELLTEDEVKAYRIADNKIAELGEWDIPNVDLEIGQLIDHEFPIEDFALDDFSIDALEDEITEDDYNEAPPEDIFIKEGDLLELGQHRVLCGDSTKEESYTELMQGKKADMVFTDPPYNINFKPPRGTHDKILNDNLGNVEFISFLSSMFVECKNSMLKDSYLITFMGWSTIAEFTTALNGLFEIKSMPIWVKNNFGIGYFTRPKYEPFYLCLKGEPEKPKKPPSDVFECAKVQRTIHSCEKPIALIADIFKHFLKGNIVLDPFLGSGSTLIACEQLKRKCYGIELDPKYCQVILNRYIKYCLDNNKEPEVKINGNDFDYKTIE